MGTNRWSFGLQASTCVARALIGLINILFFHSRANNQCGKTHFVWAFAGNLIFLSGFSTFLCCLFQLFFMFLCTGTLGWGGNFVKNLFENCQFLPPIWGQNYWKLLIFPTGTYEVASMLKVANFPLLYGGWQQSKCPNGLSEENHSSYSEDTDKDPHWFQSSTFNHWTTNRTEDSLQTNRYHNI